MQVNASPRRNHRPSARPTRIVYARRTPTVISSPANRKVCPDNPESTAGERFGHTLAAEYGTQHQLIIEQADQPPRRRVRPLARVARRRSTRREMALGWWRPVTPDRNCCGNHAGRRHTNRFPTRPHALSGSPHAPTRSCWAPLTMCWPRQRPWTTMAAAGRLPAQPPHHPTRVRNRLPRPRPPHP